MRKFRASELELKNVSREETTKFLKENHLQGSADYQISYGLYNGGELLQIITFGRPRFNKNYQYEIIRDCTKNDCIVNGGVSKIWNKFVEENSVVSCICYSYPHEKKFVSKYIDYCGFNNISKARPEKKVYFVGEWNGKEKRIDKSILARLGADRLLKGDFGHDRTNEQILLDLGFEKKEEDGLSPQVDVYYPFSVVYRVDDLTDGTFYIGMTESESSWEDGYLGSGAAWKKHLSECPNNEYERTVIACGFKTPRETRDREYKEIGRYCDKDGKVDQSTGCMNINHSTKGVPFFVKGCPECGAKYIHKRGCSHHVELKPCPECGGKGTHYKTCSRYKQSKACPECGGVRGHKKFCSKYTPGKTCEICGGIDGKHKKGCPNYIEKEACPECGSIGPAHFKACSHYKDPDACPECGVIKGHLKTCSHYKEPEACPECGGVRHHLKNCSHYKDNAVCSECGGKRGHHKKGCSKEEKCPECGYSKQSGMHAKTCSHYKAPKICPECGSPMSSHKKTCSHYKAPDVCPECGAGSGQHKKTCSHYVKPRANENICPECGRPTDKHAPGCSQAKVCPECGSRSRHKKWCSHAKKTKVCEYCGVAGGKHKGDCPNYKPPKPAKPCPECGKIRSHAPTCSKYYKNRKKDQLESLNKNIKFEK